MPESFQVCSVFHYPVFPDSVLFSVLCLTTFLCSYDFYVCISVSNVLLCVIFCGAFCQFSKKHRDIRTLEQDQLRMNIAPMFNNSF